MFLGIGSDWQMSGNDFTMEEQFLKQMTKVTEFLIEKDGSGNSERHQELPTILALDQAFWV